MIPSISGAEIAERGRLWNRPYKVWRPTCPSARNTAQFEPLGSSRRL